MSVFKISPSDANRVREMLKKEISGAHVGIDGSYEEGVIDTIAWLLGEQSFIAYDGWAQGAAKGQEAMKNLSELSRAEKNRKIAEGLGIPANLSPDFYASEESNALIVEKVLSLGFMIEMWPQACDLRLIVIFRKVIGIGDDAEYGRGHLQPDRRTAVCEAYLKLLEER